MDASDDGPHMTQASSPVAPQPEPLRLPQRKIGAFVGLLFIVFIALSAAVMLPLLMQTIFDVRGMAPKVGVVLVVLALGAKGAIECLRTLRHQGPALVVDGDGIADFRRHGVQVPWTRIARVKVDAHENHLVIHLRHEPDSSHSFATAMGQVVHRAVVGGDVLIRLHGVTYDDRALMRRIDAFMKRAKASGERGAGS
jgi:hypothetical protein